MVKDAFESDKRTPPSTASTTPSVWQRPGVSSLLDVTAAVAHTGLELYEPLVHRLQDGRVHLLHDVLQLVGVRRQVIHFYERLGDTEKV